MTETEMRISIAEACGWKFDRSSADSPHPGLADVPVWFRESDSVCMRLPDFLHDLNAMHAAEKVLYESARNRSQYGGLLVEICARDTSYSKYGREHWHATAAQRSEAFLRCLGKWKD